MDNGRIEHFNRPVREDMLDFWAFTSLRSLNNGELAGCRERYNRSHLHHALGGAAPGRLPPHLKPYNLQLRIV